MPTLRLDEVNLLGSTTIDFHATSAMKRSKRYATQINIIQCIYMHAYMEHIYACECTLCKSVHTFSCVYDLCGSVYDLCKCMHAMRVRMITMRCVYMHVCICYACMYAMHVCILCMYVRYACAKLTLYNVYI